MDWRFVFSIVSTCADIVLIVLAFSIIILVLTGKININIAKKGAASDGLNPVYSPNELGYSDDVSDEVIAVIAACIHSLSVDTGTALRIKSISPVPAVSKGSRPVWATAGITDNTRSF